MHRSAWWSGSPRGCPGAFALSLSGLKKTIHDLFPRLDIRQNARAIVIWSVPLSSCCPVVSGKHSNVLPRVQALHFSLACRSSHRHRNLNTTRRVSSAITSMLRVVSWQICKVAQFTNSLPTVILPAGWWPSHSPLSRTKSRC